MAVEVGWSAGLDTLLEDADMETPSRRAAPQDTTKGEVLEKTGRNREPGRLREDRRGRPLPVQSIMSGALTVRAPGLDAPAGPGAHLVDGARDALAKLAAQGCAATLVVHA